LTDTNSNNIISVEISHCHINSGCFLLLNRLNKTHLQNGTLQMWVRFCKHLM